MLLRDIGHLGFEVGGGVGPLRTILSIFLCIFNIVFVLLMIKGRIFVGSFDDSDLWMRKVVFVIAGPELEFAMFVLVNDRL